MSAKNLDLAIAHIINVEGGYVDHAKDPGGATNLGITRRTLANWRGIKNWQSLPKSAVQTLRISEAKTIYTKNYWHRCAADDLPGGLDICVFDFAVNSGPDRAVRQLQKIVGAQMDGWVGPQTLSAIERTLRSVSTRRLINTYLDQRLVFLSRLKTFEIFGRGWTNRVERVRKLALPLAHNNPNSAPQLNIMERLIFMNFLSGYKTYIVASAMLIAGIAEIAGVQIPAFESDNALHMIMEALAIIFLRRGVADAARA